MTTGVPRINYVIATYGGVIAKRKHALPPPHSVLQEHISRLCELSCQLSQITIMQPEISGERHSTYYELPDCARNLTIPLVTHRCENFGYSGGQWLKSYEIYGDSFDYYIFVEDDLCPNMDHFDSLLTRVYSANFPENIGLLCGVVEGSENFRDGGFPTHAEGSNFVSLKTLQRLYENPRWSGDPRSFLDSLDSQVVPCLDQVKAAYPGAYYQLTLSHLFTLSGIKHRDYVEFEIGAEGPLMVPYWSDVKNEIWFYRKGGLKFRNFLYDHVISSPFVPVQLLTKQAVFHNACPELSEDRRRAIVIIGMHRSGTSLLASCLERLGCSLGQTRNQDYDWQNPNGYFENDALHKLHNNMLEFNGHWWGDVNKPKLSYAIQHIAQYRAVLKKEFRNDPVILIKDPRLSFFIDFLIEACSNFQLKFLFCTRDRAEATRSLSRAQNKASALAEDLYDSTHAVLAKYPEGENLMVVDYYDLLYDHRETIKQISEFCALNDLDTTDLVDLQLHRNRGP